MPNKSLGQHWLKDRLILEAIADSAEITSYDTILEIGPGLGTLTSVLLHRAKEVIAVEFDAELARKLPGQFPGKNLTVHNEDILKFDLSKLPRHRASCTASDSAFSPRETQGAVQKVLRESIAEEKSAVAVEVGSAISSAERQANRCGGCGYKVVANVPYYITSKIVQLLMTSTNKPSIAVLLVQKEVAERLAATPGDMSILALSAQVFAEVSLGELVPAEYFTPPPKVDSQVVVMRSRLTPLVAPDQEKAFFRIVKAGFSAKRKKLRSSLAGGLGIEKSEVENLLKSADISPDARAEDLSIEQWQKLANIV